MSGDKVDDAKEFTFFGNYRGVVINNQDPLQAGRCQIRIFSVYDDVPDMFLPWAEYADPFMQGNAGSGGFYVPDNGAKVWCFFECGDHMQPVYFAGAPSLVDGPSNKSENLGDMPRFGVEYTQNRVIRSPSGHLIEFDDTLGDSRVRIAHRNGSQTIFYENGDVVDIVVGNYRRFVQGNTEEYVTGDSIRMITGNQLQTTVGNYFEFVTGTTTKAFLGLANYLYGNDYLFTVNGNEISTTIADYTKTIGGNCKIQSTGNAYLWSAAGVELDSPMLNLNPTTAPTVPPVAPVEGFTPPPIFALTPANASVLIEVAGPKAAFDDVGETLPAGWPAETTEAPVESPIEIEEVANPNAPLSPDCETIDKLDYSYRLSESYTIADLSRKAVFPHNIVPQNGLSVSDIVCNLKHLAVNIIEPLRAKYPKIRINSGFRQGTSNSQHNKGQAVDIQIPGASASTYTEMAKWIAKNLPFDQFILEHGKAVWIHLSYNPALGTQRGQKLTYWPSGSPQYKPGLKNYYDQGRVIT